MANSALLKSSIAKKVAMALSGLFLITFLALHFFINMTSVFSADVFNKMSHFMGYNPLIQFVMQPVLIAGVVFHFVMGIVLEIKNKNARPIAYAKYNGAANASWASRNMIISGLVVLAFLGLHFYDFWVQEITYKYIISSYLICVKELKTVLIHFRRFFFFYKVDQLIVFLSTFVPLNIL